MLGNHCLRNVLMLALCALAPACIPTTPSKPTIIMNAPAHGSEFHAGENVAVQSTSSDATGIARVELLVDGALVRTDGVAGSQATFSTLQTWQATPGTHTLAVRAYNTRGADSGIAAVTVSVSPAATPLPATKSALVTPLPAPTSTPTPRRTATPSPTRPKATYPARLQEDTRYEGKKEYNCDARGCWRADAKLDSQQSYFYPELNANNGEIQALLNSIGLPANQTTDDREKWQRVRTVWTWLNKNIIREGRPEREPAWNYLDALAQTPKDHWPSIGDMAQVFQRYRGLVWGACNSRAFMFATLLYRVGLLPDDMAVVIAQWKPEYSQHLYVVLRVGDGWYYVDPTCNESHPALSASPENVGCNTADYVHPNSIHPLPGSTLSKPMLVR